VTTCPPIWGIWRAADTALACESISSFIAI